MWQSVLGIPLACPAAMQLGSLALARSYPPHLPLDEPYPRWPCLVLWGSPCSSYPRLTRPAGTSAGLRLTKRRRSAAIWWTACSRWTPRSGWGTGGHGLGWGGDDRKAGWCCCFASAVGSMALRRGQGGHESCGPQTAVHDPVPSPTPPPCACRGAGEVKLHPWFAGMDWASLARQKVAFVPQPDCDTDTSYFSSKPVSQRSLALDLDSSRSDMLEVGASGLGLSNLGGASASLSPLPSSSLPTSRSHSRAGSKRVSSRRRSLRQALAEPSAASWSELRGVRGGSGTQSHSSGASSGSRASLAGGSDMGVEPSPGSVVRAAADLLQRQAAGGGGEQLSRLSRQQRPAAVAPTRSSTVLSGCDLPAGEPREPLDGDEEELFSSAGGSTRLGSAAGQLATSRTMEIEIEDAASVSGSPMASGDEGEYSSVEGGGGGGSFSSASGSSGSRPSPGFRGFSYTNVALLEEQNLEALRWVGRGGAGLGQAWLQGAGRRAGVFSWAACCGGTHHHRPALCLASSSRNLLPPSLPPSLPACRDQYEDEFSEFDRPPDLEKLRSLSCTPSPERLMPMPPSSPPPP